MKRRELLARATLAAALPASSLAANRNARRAAQPASPVPPDLSFLRTAPLVHGERARRFLTETDSDALVVSHPANVFYLSNHWPQLDRMGWLDTSFVIYARDPVRPTALIMHAFVYYYSHSDEAEFPGRLVFPYSSAKAGDAGAASGGEPQAAPAGMLRIVDEGQLSARERRRRAALDTARPVSADASWSLAKALRELKLDRARLAIDDPLIERLLRQRGIEAACVPGEELLRQIRLVKSPAELQLMRLAAEQNMQAAMVAARAARELGNSRAVRARFFAEAALRGNTGLFMVIDGSSSEVMNAELRDGAALSIDCVSHCRHYHGDFARTIFIGEPRESMKRATRAIGVAWDEIRGRLRAGLRFSEIRAIGREALKKQGADHNVSFTPHSVGLFHSDHPGASIAGGRVAQDLVLEAGMILSVDCPLLDTGVGGTAHLEDLSLIHSDGSEPIHAVPEKLIVV
jgi:Xaa-Pro aminopeptidase